MDIDTFFSGAIVFLLGFIVGYYLNPHWPRKIRSDE